MGTCRAKEEARELSSGSRSLMTQTAPPAGTHGHRSQHRKPAPARVRGSRVPWLPSSPELYCPALMQGMLTQLQQAAQPCSQALTASTSSGSIHGFDCITHQGADNADKPLCRAHSTATASTSIEPLWICMGCITLGSGSAPGLVQDKQD